MAAAPATRRRIESRPARHTLKAGPTIPELRRTVRVDLGERGYDILIARGLVDRVGAEVARLFAPKTPSVAALVTDSNVHALYATRVEESLDEAGIAHFTLTVPAGERSKSVDELVGLWDEMLARGLDREGVVIALGGGVVGDLAGFAAATLLRGIACVQVPTTLLAQVDSSVGGKTAIDRPAGKNLVGAFRQPAGVLVDPATLATLPRRELAAGMAEVVKHGVIRSPELFDLCEAEAEAMLDGAPAPLTEAVRLSCEIKSRVVGADECDTSGERAVLNFGHTVGHAVEAAAGFERLLHGEAVAIGMVAAGRVALSLGMWNEPSQARLEALLVRLELPVGLAGLDLDDEEVMRRLLSAKKTGAGRLYFVLPESIGRASLRREPVDETLVREVVAAL